MCGILGLYDAAGRLPAVPAGGDLAPVARLGAPSPAFGAALDRLERRGPDDRGSWSDAAVWLGHTRLSIVERSAAGHQPMVSHDGRYVIVFNGEIYNHLELRRALPEPRSWQGGSDTETLVEAYRAWGVECLSRLNGMFAFAIYDRQERSLFAARDRLGLKPLYYAPQGHTLAFASRPGALLTLFAERDFPLSADALRIYLELGFLPSPLSIHDGLRRLAPGHYLVATSAAGSLRIRIARYWDFRPIAARATWRQRPEAELVQELDDLLRNAVALRLMSDVPLGAFLSGGVDSALVVAAMKSLGGPIPRTFTIGFAEPAFDESAEAAAIARALGVEHVQERLAVDQLVELLPLFVEQFDEPFADSSAFPTMAVARLARRHVTVALSGDGADELFGGYHYYPLIERLDKVRRWPPGVRQALVALFRRAPGHRTKLLAGALGREDLAGLFAFLRGVGKDYAVLAPDLYSARGAAADWFGQFASGFAADLEPAEMAMRLDAGLTLPDLFLQKVDLATMAFSLEGRCPMTDYRVVEWAMQLPLEYKLRGGQTKYLLKRVLARYLPESMIHRPKRGFAVPLAAWLRGPLRPWAEALIHDDGLMSRVPLQPAAVRTLLRQHLRGERQTHPILWTILMLLAYVDRRRGARAAAALDRREAA